MPRKKGTPHKIDISGLSFGEWTVINRYKGSKWNCKCSCGKEHIVNGSALKLGTSTKCKFCRNRKHGQTVHADTKTGRTRIYGIWTAMMARCNNPNHVHYSRYGGRGIKVCNEWNSFEEFYSYVGDAQKGLSIDRIDNDLGYQPGNIRWASVKEQARNRRNSSLHTVNGETKTIAEWAEIKNMPARQLRLRMATKNITMEQAIALPYNPRT